MRNGKRISRNLVVAGHHGNDAAFAGYPRELDAGFVRWLDHRYHQGDSKRIKCIAAYFDSFDAAIVHLNSL